MDDVLTHELDGVVHVTLNRPERRNALSRSLLDHLQGIADDLAQRRGEVRALVLRGAGGVFCAGGDVKEFRAAFQDDAPDKQGIAASNRRYGTLLTTLDRLPVVVIAAVEGAAMGGGVGLAAVADITVATAPTRFSLTETTLGLPPAQIAAFVVARIGAHQARRLMLTAARIDAAAALGLGLVDEVVPDAVALDAAVERVLGRVRRCAPLANAMTKDLVHATSSTALGELLDAAADQFAVSMLGAEARHGVASFIEQQEPTW